MNIFSKETIVFFILDFALGAEDFWWIKKKKIS